MPSLSSLLLGALLSSTVDGACPEVLGVWREGARVSSVCATEVDERGLLVVDLGDEWVPRFLLGDDGQPVPYAATYRALANEHLDGADVGARAARDRFFELWGIPPSPSVMQRRLDDVARHACHDAVDHDDELALGVVVLPLRPSALGQPSSRTRTIARLRRRAASGRATADESARLAHLVDVDGAARALLAHLVCDGLLSSREARGGFGPRATSALATLQRREALVVDEGVLDDETRWQLLLPSRRRDWRALLRVVRERVVDAAGLVEDGSAGGGETTVADELLDARAVRTATMSTAAPGGAPDVIDAAADAVVRALGLADESTAGARLLALPRGRVAVAADVAEIVRPKWHGPHMNLEVTIDVGDIDVDGLWRPGMRRTPTLTLTTVVDDGAGGETRFPLVRWPTTVGGWQRERLESGDVVDARKPSPAGDVVWGHVWAQPAWYAPPTTPDDDLLLRAGDGVVVNDEAIGPGYRSAYGLVMFPHERARSQDGTLLVDTAVRTHGTGNVRSVLRGGPSHGCHRLLPVHAQRLATFLLRHRAHRWDGLVRQPWQRRFSVVVGDEDSQAALVARRRLRGAMWTLTPPLPVRVVRSAVAPRVRRRAPTSGRRRGPRARVLQ